MSKVKWRVTDRETMRKERTSTGRMKKNFSETTVDDIIYNWDNNLDVKVVKVTSGRSNVVEMEIYNSGPYLTYRKKMKKNLEVIEGMFAVNILRTKLGETADEIVRGQEHIQMFRQIVTTLNKGESWIEQSELHRALYQLQEAMENVDAYDMMDKLLAD